MSATPIDPQKLQLKRKLCISTFTIGLPAYYLIKNRNNIYKASKLVREFYFKDIIARSFFGFIIGVGASIYLYGPDPDIKTNRDKDKEGRAVI
jgi:hypothetical protein